jgi:hypothetical protein
MLAVMQPVLGLALLLPFLMNVCGTPSMEASSSSSVMQCAVMIRLRKSEHKN